MQSYEEKLQEYLSVHSIDAEHIHFDASVHTVEDACQVLDVQPDDFVKTICMVDENLNAIGALVPGSNRASTSRVGKALGIQRPNIATPEQALKKTGYLVGGTPPFGYEAIFLIDPLILEKNVVYVGGGAPNALVKISVQELQRVIDGRVVRVRK